VYCSHHSIYRFSDSTYRAIGRRWNASIIPKYIITYAREHTLKKYNFQCLHLIHKEAVTMVGHGGRQERKTAYFYERKFVSDHVIVDKMPCDQLFLSAVNGMKLEIGERYQCLVKQRQPFMETLGKVQTRRGVSSGIFIESSDEETTCAPSDEVENSST